MKFQRPDGVVVDAYEFAKLREAPREFAEAICYSKHGVENPDRAPHLHGHTPRSSAIMHFISDGYWLFQRLDTGFIYALNGEDFAAVYRPVMKGGAA